MSTRGISGRGSSSPTMRTTSWWAGHHRASSTRPRPHGTPLASSGPTDCGGHARDIRCAASEVPEFPGRAGLADRPPTCRSVPRPHAAVPPRPRRWPGVPVLLRGYLRASRVDGDGPVPVSAALGAPSREQLDDRERRRCARRAPCRTLWMIPGVILLAVYQGFVYRTFKGKVVPGTGAHY
jgi:hypothetical protein